MPCFFKFKVHYYFILEGGFYRKIWNILVPHGIEEIQCFPGKKLPGEASGISFFQFVPINPKFTDLLLKFLGTVLSLWDNPTSMLSSESVCSQEELTAVSKAHRLCSQEPLADWIHINAKTFISHRLFLAFYFKIWSCPNLFENFTIPKTFIEFIQLFLVPKDPSSEILLDFGAPFVIKSNMYDYILLFISKSFNSTKIIVTYIEH